MRPDGQGPRARLRWVRSRTFALALAALSIAAQVARVAIGCAVARAAGAPLSLKLVARKGRVAVGEGIVIDIHQRVAADLDLESVELNRDRTRVTIRRLDVGARDPHAQPLSLTGADAIKLHRRSPLQGVGSKGRARAGSAWTSALELLQYTRPLAAGRYRIGLSYRLGDGPAAAVIDAGTVDVEVVPAALASAAFHWFGGATPRDQLGALWTADVDGRRRWYYEVASAHDPTVVDTSVDLEIAGTHPLGAPLLAHLGGIAATHYERRVAWVDAAGLGWLRVHAGGRAGGPMFLSHGLGARPAPRLVDPPLQTEDDALRAVVVGAGPGGRPTASVAWAPPNGTPAAPKLWPLGATWPTALAVWWGPTPSGPAASGGGATAALYRAEPSASGGTAGDGGGRTRIVRTDLATGADKVLFDTADRVVALVVDEWSGLARLTAVLRGPESLTVMGWDLLAGSDPRPERLFSHDLRSYHPPLADPATVATLDAGRGAAALFARTVRSIDASKSATDVAWLLVSPDRTSFFAAADASPSASPSLIATPADGIYLLAHDPRRGSFTLRPAAP